MQPAKQPKIPGHNVNQLQNFSPEMQQLFQQLIQSLSGGSAGAGDFLSKLASGDEETYQGLEAPAFRNFQEAIGQIGTRYSHLGAGNSSYSENAMSGAGQSLAENLQSQRLGLRSKAIESLLNNSQQLLQQRPTENVVSKKPAKFDWLQAILHGAGEAGKTYLAGQ
jgi:hypothetical protein